MMMKPASPWQPIGTDDDDEGTANFGLLRRAKSASECVHPFSCKGQKGLLIDDLKVTVANIEPGGEFTVSGADEILNAL
nr:thioredoxin peroxidase CATP [Ipomoea trifida]